MIGLMLALAAQTGASEVVVTAKRLEDASIQCGRKGACPPLRDAQVSIAWAEHQFRKGDYLNAKRTLVAALSRNRDFAKSDPRPVAAIYEALGTVSLHEGDVDTFRRVLGARSRVVRDNLPANDPTVTAAELAVGDMWIKLGDVRSADATYQGVERRARARGQSSVAMIAALRRVALTGALGNMKRAEAMLVDIAREAGASNATIAAIMPVVRLRLAAQRADDAEIDSVLATLSRTITVRPTLVWGPKYRFEDDHTDADGTPKYDLVLPNAARSSDSSPILWADIGFWIRPDGRTADVEILRGSRARSWLNPVVSQINGRRYTGASGAAATEGVYRIERFTYRPTYVTPVGSLVRRRAGPRELEVLDLTAPDQAAIATR